MQLGPWNNNRASRSRLGLHRLLIVAASALCVLAPACGSGLPALFAPPGGKGGLRRRQTFPNLMRVRGGASGEAGSAGSLRDIIRDEKLNFIFVGGKGGVGKTTCSSALAIQRAKHCLESGRGDVLLISTDPAHSLSDAFKMKFTGEPTQVPGVKGLWVMEVEPSKIIKKEMDEWSELAKQSGMDEFIGEFSKFQNWMTALPGIDEATALASALERIRSKQFGTIVFDTAPTGHTVKLLGLPDVLQVGINKLSSFSSKIMGYITTFKNLFNPNAAESPNLQNLLSEKLKKYQESVQVLGDMLKDKEKTNFVIVCIAEYLSVQESARLVEDLKFHGIANSHIIVNQLVQGAPTAADVQKLKPFLSELSKDQQDRVNKCMRLMGAREAIQSKYLRILREDPSTKNITVVPMPLLPEEVTGPEKLERFSGLLNTGYRSEKDDIFFDGEPSSR
mmetsp:Transcript_19942/g.48824  ORF Transcript_19942/g.48824 Transcript_19942/m.48824 type:complete len:449 (-) Transcript_19942:48-1394(-)